MKWDEKFKRNDCCCPKQLGIIQPRLTRFAVNQEIIPGFMPFPHQVIHQGRQQLGLAQTMLYSFTQQMSYTTRHKSLNQMAAGLWCRSPAAAQTRQQILEMVASERRLVFAYHFPFQELACVRAVGLHLGANCLAIRGSMTRNTNSCSVAAQSWKPRGNRCSHIRVLSQ